MESHNPMFQTTVTSASVAWIKIRWTPCGYPPRSRHASWSISTLRRSGLPRPDVKRCLAVGHRTDGFFETARNMENPWNINGNYQWTWRFIAGKNLKYRYRDLRWYWQPIVPSLLGTLCQIQWNMPLKWRHHRSNSTTVCQTFACLCKQSSLVIPVCHWYPLIKETIICMMAVSNILQKSCQLGMIFTHS